MKPAPSTRKAIASTATQDRRANSLSSPPNTRVPPATISAIREMESATGPVIDCATRLSGVSQGNPPPPAPAAKAACAPTSNKTGSTHVRPRTRFENFISFVPPSFGLEIFDRVPTVFVPVDQQQLT